MSLSFLPPVPTEASLQCLLKVSSGPAWENPVSGEDGSEWKVLVCWDRRGLGTRACAVLAASEAPPPSPSGQCQAPVQSWLLPCQVWLEPGEKYLSSLVVSLFI